MKLLDKEFQHACHENAIKKGFWKKSQNVPEKLALMHSEISEALEDYRKNKMDYYEDENGKPCGFGSEMVDTIIRIGDLVEYLRRKFPELNLNLGWIAKKKMAYNSKRPYLHGGKKA